MRPTQLILVNSQYILQVSPANLQLTHDWLNSNQFEFSTTVRKCSVTFLLTHCPKEALARLAAKYPVVTIPNSLMSKFADCHLVFDAVEVYESLLAVTDNSIAAIAFDIYLVYKGNGFHLNANKQVVTSEGDRLF
jgi:hypothetical protein